MIVNTLIIYKCYKLYYCVTHLLDSLRMFIIMGSIYFPNHKITKLVDIINSRLI